MEQSEDKFVNLKEKKLFKEDAMSLFRYQDSH